MIRQISEDDWQVFHRLRLEALLSDPGAYSGTAEEWRTVGETQLRAMLGDIAVFVVSEEGEPVGMMGLIRHKAGKMAHRAILVMVYMRGAIRGSGLAQRLHDEVVAHARSAGIRQIELHVTAENLRAARFYERLGYLRIGTIPGGFFEEGREIDEVLMALRF